jgi:hypothetical protein
LISQDNEPGAVATRPRNQSRAETGEHGHHDAVQRPVLLVRLFDLPCESPHCLSVAPHNAKSRARDPNRRPRILQFTQFFTNGRCSQCARAVRRSETGNLRLCVKAQQSNRQLSWRQTGALGRRPNREVAREPLERCLLHGNVEAVRSRIDLARLGPLSTGLSVRRRQTQQASAGGVCYFGLKPPRKVVFSGTNQPNGDRHRGQH